MIDYNISTTNNSKINNIRIKHLSLDYKLDFFLLIDSNDINYVEIIESKIIDLVIDNISKENTYKDFSVILEKINQILREYYKTKNASAYLNILISIGNDKDFIFSQIGRPSLYLIKTNGETIEVTDKTAKNKEFNYISEGILEHRDILILSTKRLLKYLSYSDFVDASQIEETEIINKNIELILNDDNLTENIGLLTIKYTDKKYIEEKKSKLKGNISKIYYKIIDNNFIKLSLAYFKISKEKLEKKSKLIRNFIILFTLILSSLLFFFILTKTINNTNNTNNIINSKEELADAKKFKIIASNNYNSPEVFYSNIEKSEEIIKKLKEKKLFINDIKLLEQDINNIKKAFNGIETFNENSENIIYKIPENIKNNIIKTLNINGKNYIITNNSIIGPILNNIEVKNNIFSKLGSDEFIDATDLNNSIILLTKKGKIVEFNKSSYFSFKDVIGQETWEKADKILSYGQKIYLTNSKTSQIYKHELSGKKFKKAIPYLKLEDQKYIGHIESLAIDGGFYILKGDLKLLKFFSNPYRFEEITIKKLPKTYKKEENSRVILYARKDLNYIYMILNNKIWIFKPNTKFYTKTKFITYLGQIEATNNKIIDFFIEKDGNINVLTKSGLYNIEFNENDGRILVND